MTSIAGLIDFEQVPDLHLLETMLDALPGHFGGDRDVRSLGAGRFGRTLSIRVPEDEFDQQPLSIADRFLIVADIRIDNRADQAAALSANVDRLSDSDVLSMAWNRWQEQCLDKIDGDFAIAVYDHIERCVWLARDRCGRRPLYWTKTDERVAFASMPGGILASQVTPAEFDHDHLIGLVLGLYTLDDSTPFARVHAVQPGQCVRIARNGVTATSYWTPDDDPLDLDDEQFEDSYRKLFDQAVAASGRRAGGRLGVHLSSGFDSSAVAAAAALVHPNDLPIAFTAAPRAGFDGPVPRDRIGDEAPLAALTAAHYNLDHRIIRSSGSALAGMRDQVRICQQPDLISANQSWAGRLYRQAQDDGVTTLLNGIQGNLSIHFGGLMVLADWVRRRGVRQWWRQARAARALPTVRWRGILFNSFEPWMPGRLIDGLKRMFVGIPPVEEQSFLAKRWSGSTATRRQAQLDYFNTHTLMGDRLAVMRTGDQALAAKGTLAAFGIDERDPCSDRRLIEFSYRLPPEQLLKDGVSRPLMRRVLSRRLPREVMENPRRGLQTADWYEHFDHDEALAILDEISGCETVWRLIDLPRLRERIEEWPTSGWADSGVIWTYRMVIPATLSLAMFILVFEEMMASSDYRHPCR